jgi:cation:H+ antiporter
LGVGERVALAPMVGLIAIGFALLAGCALLMVVSSVNIATDLGVSELVIGLTIVSMGTSAPELITSVVAALRKQSDISFGNVLGSNVFNVLGIGGVTAMLGSPELNQQVLRLDLPVLCALSIASFPIVWTGQRISRIEGVVLLSVYLGYLAVLFWLAPGWFAAG